MIPGCGRSREELNGGEPGGGPGGSTVANICVSRWGGVGGWYPGPVAGEHPAGRELCLWEPGWDAGVRGAGVMPGAGGGGQEPEGTEG